ncbi:MAG: cytochrome c3 family protein, partial [Planctomycetota bacterium]
ELRGLCLDCHDEISDVIETASNQHEKSNDCTTCHEHHASTQDKLLSEPSASVCLTCHNRTLPRDAHIIADFKTLLKEKPIQHGPIADGDCVSCHAFHQSDHHPFLNAEYPKNFYSAFGDDTYTLCFDCHDIEAFEDEETDDATEFRNGSQNLHYLHVNRTRKGRTCRACHEVHAASLPKLIAESVPFGSWRIPIGFEPMANGGTCQPGCHRQYSYDRDTPVDNLP